MFRFLLPDILFWWNKDMDSAYKFNRATKRFSRQRDKFSEIVCTAAVLP